MDRQGISFILGERLKSLREERGLSHVELTKQLNEKYGISVSRDSVMAYEISDESRAKASKLPNLGMRVEYLYCLADFYNVSTNYLLGLSDDKEEIPSVSKSLGLTTAAIETLKMLKDFDYDNLLSGISFLIEQETPSPFDLIPEQAVYGRLDDAQNRWERKQYIPLLSILWDYIRTKKTGDFFFVDAYGNIQLAPPEDENGMRELIGRISLDGLREIGGEQLIAQVLISDAMHSAEKVRNKYQDLLTKESK